MAKGKQARVSIRLPLAAVEMVQQRACGTGRTVGDTVRSIVLEALGMEQDPQLCQRGRPAALPVPESEE